MRNRITWPYITALVALFIFLWIGVWILHDHLAVFGIQLVTGSDADTIYWVFAKFLIWVVFPFCFFALPLRKQVEFIGLQAKNIRRGLVFGIGAAALWLALSAIRFFLTGQHFGLTMSFFIVFYTVILTPIFEEILFRGYIQSSLVALKTNFLLADLITTLLFLIPHCIGWSFQGVLSANLTLGGIGTLAIISLVLGFIRYQSNSLAGNVLLHMINNLISVVAH